MPQPSQQSPVSSSPPKVDDAVLLRKIADGDVAALGTLFDHMARPVYSLAMQLLRNHDAAEDIVESTYWLAWQEAAQLSENPDPRSWLLETARRRALEHLRSRRRQREELLLDKRQFGDLVSVSAGNVGSDDSGDDFMHMLSNLEHPELQVIELAYFRGLSQQDIADLIGEAAPTIKNQMRAALTKLRPANVEESVPE